MKSPASRFTSPGIQTILFLILLQIVSLAPAVAADGGVPAKLVEGWLETELSPPEQALADAIANRNIKDIALNRERFIAHNTFFSNKFDAGKVTNQKGSGRCWMFAGFNVLRPEVMSKHDLSNFEFSENYLMFWDKIEKSNLFLQLMIDFANRPLDDRKVAIILDGPISDGGWWTYFVNLVEKYGVVPVEVMPETHNSSSTGTMNKLVGLKVIEMGMELRQRARSGMSDGDLTELKEEMLSEIYRLLVLNLGTPPGEFTWRYEARDSTEVLTWPEKLTPKQFFNEVVDLDLGSYVALFNYPGKEYYKPYALEMSRNMYDTPDFSLLNMPIDSLRAGAVRSLVDSTAVWFACDVGEDHYGADGIMTLGIYNYEALYNTRFTMSKTDLIRTGLVDPNHAMTFTGVDLIDSTPVKWLVENSWGTDRGDDGMYYIYNDWFDKYLIGVILHERYLSPEVIDMARQTPTLLPPWDPMYGLTNLE
jgi:bleomycin hydrolase